MNLDLSDRNTVDTVILVLAGLARANGGSIYLDRDELGVPGDQIYLEVHPDKSITVHLLPDYVKVGVEKPYKPKDEAKKVKFVVDPSTTSATWTANFTFDEIK